MHAIVDMFIGVIICVDELTSTPGGTCNHKTDGKMAAQVPARNEQFTNHRWDFATSIVGERNDFETNHSNPIKQHLV